MGLLERALKYKNRLNENGRETLIDRIAGPAETEQLNNVIEKINVDEIDNERSQEFEVQKIQVEIIEENDESAFPENENIFKDEEIILPEDEPFKPGAHHEDESLFDDEIISEDAEPELFLDNTEELPDTEYENIIDEDQIKSVVEIKTIPEVLNDSNFNDYGTLYEVQNEFIKSESIEDIYSNIIFSIMGQVGVTSVSIIGPSEDNSGNWKILDSSGINLPDDDFYWKTDSGVIHLLNVEKHIIDIESLKNESSYRDDYYKFTAVDTRVIIPVFMNDLLVGAVLVGEKIDSEDFTESDFDFLNEISFIASSVNERIVLHEKTITELVALRIEKEIIYDVELFQDSILRISSATELKDAILKNFYSLGIESYALFMNERPGGDFYPEYFETADNLEFFNSGYKIKNNNRLVTFLTNKRSSIILENFNESSVVIDTFGRDRILKMDYFIAYPFIIAGKLSGFITIFKINPAVELVDVDIRLQKINRFLFPYLHRFLSIDVEKNKFEDLTSIFYEKIENDIVQASELNIPLSIILFTVKNYKRFIDRFGKIEFTRFLSMTSDVIREKLGDGDYSAKIDKAKYMVVLPGKDKRYSLMFANSVINEISDNYKNTDFKLLVTPMITTYPEDGRDLFSLLEVVE